MLSYQRIGSSQCGHRESGLITDSPFGTRVMQTFKKLPKSRPRTKAKGSEKKKKEIMMTSLVTLAV